MKKRLLSLVLAFCLALSLAPAAFAANIVDSGTCGADANGSNIAWTLDADGNLTVTGAGLLQKKAFQNRKDIVTVKFVCTDDRDVMSINILDYAFAGCTNLRSIDFGSRDARDLHAHAFEGCTSLTDIHFGSSFGYISAYAFRGCTSLRQVTFPYTVFQVSKYAFADCTALTEVTFEPDPDGMGGLSTLGSHAFAGCTSLRAVNVPERLNRIDSYAFSGCSSLEWLPIEQFDVLEAHSFAGWTGLKSAVLSPQLKSLPDGLFDGCTGLQRVTVQNNVTSIGTGVFTGCTALTDVYYTGTQTQWDQIRTPKGEDVLGSAELHCNAAAHTFAGDWVETTPATCTDDGVLTRTCTDPGCGRTQTRIVPSLGHDWDDGVTRIEPDGLLAGVVVYTCGRCALTAIELTAPEIWAYQHFTDLDPESWSYEGIQYCVATGLMSGVGGTTFLPGGVTTRAQLVQILYNLEGEPAVTGSTPFTDLTADWYQDAVTWAYQNHIVSGTSATTFAPDLVVTREQIAVVLVDFLMNVYGLERTWIPAALDVYPDGPDVSDWAQAGMSDALSLKLISGATNGESLVRHLNPRAGATRAEVATILENMCSGVLGIG